METGRPASHAMYVSTIHEERPGSHEAANFFRGGSKSVILAINQKMYIDSIADTSKKEKRIQTHLNKSTTHAHTHTHTLSLKWLSTSISQNGEKKRRILSVKSKNYLSLLATNARFCHRSLMCGAPTQPPTAKLHLSPASKNLQAISTLLDAPKIQNPGSAVASSFPYGRW